MVVVYFNQNLIELYFHYIKVTDFLQLWREYHVWDGLEAVVRILWDEFIKLPSPKYIVKGNEPDREREVLMTDEIGNMPGA